MLNTYSNRINQTSLEFDVKSRYKRLVRRKKRSFEINKIRKIERLRHSQPREFWKLFIKRKNTGSDIPLQDFF